MLQGVYKGDNTRLKGETALLQVVDDTTFKAQFDNRNLLVKPELLLRGILLNTLYKRDLQNHYGYGWHTFPKESFEVVK